MQSDFICHRKHLFRDSIYQIEITNNELILFNSSRKYIIQLYWTVEFSWNIEGVEWAFGVRVNQKFKWFHSKPNIIQQLRDKLCRLVTSTNFKLFYSLGVHIKKGENSNVYECSKKGDNQFNLVAKCIGQMQDIKKLHQELNILKQLNHPDLPVFLDFFYTNDIYYIIMEKCEGQQLDQLITESKQSINIRLIQQIMIECFNILQYLEQMQIIHRDISPNNILFYNKNKKTQIKLLDFGQATNVNTDIKKCGTPGYIAPEILAELPHNCSSDMFSLGCLFYKLLVKKDLFQGNNKIEILQENKKCKFNLQTLNLIRIPSSAQNLLQQMLHLDPRLRIKPIDALQHPFIKESLIQNSSQNSTRSIKMGYKQQQQQSYQNMSFFSKSSTSKLEDDIQVDYFNNELPPMSKIPVMDQVKGGCRYLLDSIFDTETKSHKQISNSVVLYYFITCRCQLHYIPTELNQSIIQKCSIIRKKMFYYTPYLFTGLLQAFIASKVQHIDPKLKFIREYVDFGQDFGLFALDWGSYEGKITEQQSQDTINKPLVIVLSGLTASRIEPYITNFFSKFCQYKSDWRIVLYNDRLFNNRVYQDPNRQILPQKGNFHHVEDFRRVLQYIVNKNNKSQIYAVAHSFGSNTLVKYLGMCGSNGIDPLIKAAVSIGNPYDFQLGMRYLEDSLSDSYIRKHRQRITKEKIKQYIPIPKHYELNLDKVQQAKTSLEFDTYFTKPIFNSPTVDFHYLSIQCVNYIEFIKIPLFLLGSYDDPVINNKGVYPIEAIKKNKYLISMMTQVGGHISWFEGIFNLNRWYYKPVIQYLNAIHQLL